MFHYSFKQTSAAQSIGQRKVSLGRIQSVLEFRGPLTIHIVFTLHPVNCLEEFRPLPLVLQPNFPLNFVAEFTTAGGAPQSVQRAHVFHGDVFDFRPVDPAALEGSWAGCLD